MKRSILRGSLWASMLTIGLMVVVTATTAARAEEHEPAAKKHENVDWYRLVHVDFKPGKSGDALKLVRQHFAPAGQAAGTPGPVSSFVHESGPWDVTWVWHLSGGPSDLEWDVSPNNLKWMAALAEQEGGMEEARKRLAEYSALVSSSTSYIVRGWSPVATGGDD